MNSEMLRSFFHVVWPRGGWRMPVLGLLYAIGLALSMWLAYLLRFDFVIPDWALSGFAVVCAVAVLLKLTSLFAFHQFDGLLSFFSTPDLRRLLLACGIGSLSLTAIRLGWGVNFAPPRGVIVTDFVLSMAVLATLRLGFRQMRVINMGEQPRRKMRRVAIIGAGECGARLARELFAKPSLHLLPTAFFDDRRGTNCSVHGRPVLGPPERLPALRKKLALDEVIIAMPSASAKRIREVVELSREAGLPCRTVPSFHQLASGQVSVSHVRPVEIEDLLGRSPVQIERGAIREILAGRTVLVTGAGGSIGSELCRQILSFGPKKLLLVERSEPHLFLIEQELRGLPHGSAVVPLVGDITRIERMREIFRAHQPEAIFHAAAHKHVPMMEHQCDEAIRNNTVGTAQLADLAAEFGVERFVLVSTDKAVNPTSVMGATKRWAEIYVQSLAAVTTRTRFVAVRFGNVLGSSGSVVPIFAKQIAAGGPVTVTDPEMTRYFMTIPEAAALVLQSAAFAHGGEIFVLDMGRPVRIFDLARQMIALSGVRPGEVEVVFTGLRPGEKMYEELSHGREAVTTTPHPKIRCLVSQPSAHAEVRRALAELVSALNQPSQTAEGLKQLLARTIPEYTPYGVPASAPMIDQISDRAASGAKSLRECRDQLAGAR